MVSAAGYVAIGILLALVAGLHVYMATKVIKCMFTITVADILNGSNTRITPSIVDRHRASKRSVVSGLTPH